MFSSEEFLNQQTIDTKLETAFSPIPAGEYVGMLSKLEAKEQPKTDGTGHWTIVDLFWAIDDARAKEATGMESPQIKDSVFLDMENGKLATGKNKNIQLGRYLEALGLNGVPGNPFAAMRGKAAKLQVTVEPDKKDPTRVFNRVKAVGKL
jgi:hypothetical protein